MITDYLHHHEAYTIPEEASFWLNEGRRIYPFEVQFADIPDAQGVVWKIGYMDVYLGDDFSKAKAESIIMVHGKGANAGGFANLMYAGLKAGYRVVAMDLPHYGFSIPYNLDKPLARTLEDCRDVIYNLVVEYLNIPKAYYLGHSMGGQLLMGLALKHPEIFHKLMLEAPAGLEEFPEAMDYHAYGIHGYLELFSPDYLRDIIKWHHIWDPTGFLNAEYQKTADIIDLFYFFKKFNHLTNKIEDSAIGYFKVDNPWSRIYTNLRKGMINQTLKEYHNYIVTYVRDMYSIGVELRRNDPNSLTKHLQDIQVPIFLTFGAEECLIPTTIFSGNKSLLHDILLPAVERFSRTGYPFTFKVYPQVGHFIHTDAPEEYAHDMIKFFEESKN